MKQKSKTSLTHRLCTLCLLILLCPFVPAQNLLNPLTQPQFVNPLPVPSVIDARNGGLFTMGITQFNQWLGLVNPVTAQPMTTTVWGYNGSYPGPTILAKKDVPVDVFWHNNLVDGSNQPLPHLLPVDKSLHWALDNLPAAQQIGVPVVTHLHGGHSESASDGLPNAWFTPGFALKGDGFVKGEEEPYHYDNSQEAATVWYHDHALGLTRLNVYAGLAGYYLITDQNEMNLQAGGSLPAAPYDLGLAIQDKMFLDNGQLYYPSMPVQAGQPNPSILPEFFGDFILVNGMTWPVLEVEPRQYRFRVLNGSDSRFYDLNISGKQVIYQIGTDNGLLASPVPLAQIVIGPGERKDIIVDFSNPALWGQTLYMRNNGKIPFPKGGAVDPRTTGSVMAFKVTKPLDPLYPRTTLPATLRAPIVPLQTNLPARKLILFEATDQYNRLKPMLGTVANGVLEFQDPISENPALNSTEIWEIYNETVDAHPIHLHLVTTQLVNRQKFTAVVDPGNGKPANIRLIGLPRLPTPDERGWKDTWIMLPGEVTRIIAKFDREGLYAWHCHILSHEDHEMMRPYYVGTMSDQATHTTQVKMADPGFEKQVALQAVPNPFSDQLALRFNLAQASEVRVNLFDAKGSLVKKNAYGSLAKGMHNLAVSGTGLNTGVYFCEVLINDQRLMRKVVLQK
jgi:spore coat protein A